MPGRGNRPQISTLDCMAADWDFSLFNNIMVTEGKEFQFRAEAFNLLNHTNFRLPDSDISSPTFNRILEAQLPRLIQLALKFPF